MSQTSPKARTVAVPKKSSTMIRAHSAPFFFEIWRVTPVTTQASSIF